MERFWERYGEIADYVMDGGLDGIAMPLLAACAAYFAGHLVFDMAMRALGM